MQQALVALTGVPLGEQIMMCEGARLDPHKPLSAYGLPVVSAARSGIAEQLPAPVGSQLAAGRRV